MSILLVLANKERVRYCPNGLLWLFYKLGQIALCPAL
jgi:hypothetical protein